MLPLFVTKVLAVKLSTYYRHFIVLLMADNDVFSANHMIHSSWIQSSQTRLSILPSYSCNPVCLCLRSVFQIWTYLHSRGELDMSVIVHLGQTIRTVACSRKWDIENSMHGITLTGIQGMTFNLIVIHKMELISDSKFVCHPGLKYSTHSKTISGCLLWRKH